MEDYYTKVNAMTEDKLSDEIQKLYKKILVMNSNSPMYDQLLQMLDTVETAYQEKIYVSRFKNDKTSSVIDIGVIDEIVSTPNYTADELLLAVVSLYTKNTGDT
jgi:tRNA A37 N6-isopentenylltransferase MiaA